MKRNRESGQALLIVVVVLGVFTLGAVGLAIDGGRLYIMRQMAQTAADSAAQAGAMSMFDHTAGDATHGFPTSGSFTCTEKPNATPCVYAKANGFGSTAADSISVTTSGIQIQVTVSRTVDTTFMRVLGTTAATVGASATAAIVDTTSPVPIVITHPKIAEALSLKDNATSLIITGGPPKSIQVNSSDPQAVGPGGTIDLFAAGPGGQGGDFGLWGGPTAPPFTFDKGPKSEYLQPASPVPDPLEDVPAPAKPGAAPAPVPNKYAAGDCGCPATMPHGDMCTLYQPGDYPSGITVAGSVAVFAPGIYYIDQGGFHIQSNGVVRMATCFAHVEGFDDPVHGPGMLLYNTGTNTANDIFEITSNAGQYQGVDMGNALVGSQSTSEYRGILFFENRDVAATLTHSLRGGGGLDLVGTIYLTNTATEMNKAGGHYQTLNLQGNPSNSTHVEGQIITSVLHLGGSASIKMTLSAVPVSGVKQVALIQ